MEKNPYIAVLVQSLKKKNEILDMIMMLNKRQKQELENPNLEPDEFDKTVEEKAKLVDELNKLDDGFKEVFEKAREDLEQHKAQYADEIKEMQEYIRKLTEKSASIQAQEMRNKDLMTQKFSSIRRQAREVRTSQKVVNQYYKNMMKTNYIDPQFTDSKK